MKKWLEKQIVFNFTLRIFAVFARRKWANSITYFLTTQSARLNLKLNKPKSVEELSDLAKTWKALMPPDGQEHFKIKEITEDTAYTEIHLPCPLREKGDVHACHRLMNYDQKLMEAVGGQLIVLQSQSDEKHEFCRLAIRKAGAKVDDLVPAHLVKSEHS